ncbi:MAG TPA: Calx-beta domain-containing protein [Acidimicrobiales bacterium]|nr:Calx-beta domain-containing protein [Acidimicrobiales bacterium]
MPASPTARGTATIVRDEGAITAGPKTFFSVNDLSVTEGSALAPGTATLTVTGTGSTTKSSTVTYATANGTAVKGSDYKGKAATTITFAAGETTTVVTVTLIGNTVSEATETCNLNLSAPTNGSSPTPPAWPPSSTTTDRMRPSAASVPEPGSSPRPGSGRHGRVASTRRARRT